MDRLYAALRAAGGKRVVFFSVMAALLIRFLCCSKWALKRSLTKLLKNQPFSDSFLQTPESFQTVFWNKEYRLQLLVSETWLILISTNCSLIRPKDAFCGAERVLLENEYEHAVRLLFADGSAICRCEHICDELIEILHTIR